MKITDQLHLCYSLNVYPGSTLENKINIIENKIPQIRDEINWKTSPFAIGLWLDSKTIDEIDESKTDQLKEFLNRHNLYTFTANAFPYGTFHGENVKTNVYSPDWRSLERVNYTCKVADVLCNLLADDITGSISTLPGSYSSWISDEKEISLIAQNILKVASHLKCIYKKTGKKIILAIEMEPDCLWENPGQFIAFFNKYIRQHKELAKYVGVCYDTCHQELLNNPPGSGLRMIINADITIAKIQFSAAIIAKSRKDYLETVFQDNVYLHQTRSIDKSGKLKKYSDLQEAIKNGNTSIPWLIHYHVPIYCDQLGGGLQAAKDEMIETLRIIKSTPEICSNIEIETYTYSILPEHLKPCSIEKSISKEYNWLIDKIRG